MVKKRVKRASRRISRRVGRSIAKISKQPRVSSMPPGNRKIMISVKNLLFFSVLSLICFLLYSISSSMYQTLFYLLTMLFVFVALAFFLVLLILVFMRLLKK